MAQSDATKRTRTVRELIAVAKDTVAGTLGGVAGVLVGHPFDTVKVRLQTDGLSQTSRGPFKCLVETVQKEGIRGLYKGVTPPIAGEAVTNAIVFATYGFFKRLLMGTDDIKAVPTLPQTFIAGAGAGVAAGVILCPFELVKNRLQVQGEASVVKGKPLYSGPIDCVVKTLKQQGLRGLFRGLTPTWGRDIPSFAFYFWAYDATRRALTPPGKSVHDLSPFALIIAGGVGGIACWLSSYPSDVVKTRMQIQMKGVTPESEYYKSTWDCVRRTYKEGGVAAFYKGLTPTLVRAVPVNAAIFVVYELTIRLLSLAH